MSQYKLTDLDGFQLEISTTDVSNADLVLTSDSSMHLIQNKQGFDVQLMDIDVNAKVVTLSVNGQEQTWKIRDEIDQVVDQLGFSTPKVKKLDILSAPMPGLVVEIQAKVGQEVNEGDNLLVLEAMKMENMLHASGVGVIKEIHVKAGENIEKGALLITFE